jgi:hypothetical protein
MIGSLVIILITTELIQLILLHTFIFLWEEASSGSEGSSRKEIRRECSMDRPPTQLSSDFYTRACNG